VRHDDAGNTVPPFIIAAQQSATKPLKTISDALSTLAGTDVIPHFRNFAGGNGRTSCLISHHSTFFRKDVQVLMVDVLLPFS
jgi:hypothetical protein